LYGDALAWLGRPLDTSRSDAVLGERMRVGREYRDVLSGSAQRQREDAADLDRLSSRQAAEREAARPGELVLPSAPSMAARGFADPGPSAGLLQQLQSVMLGAGLLAEQIAGLRGSSTAAVSALRGAFQGWAEGDRERAERSLTQWEAASKKLLQEHRARVEAYRGVVEDQQMSWAEKMNVLSMRAKADEFQGLAKATEIQDWDQVLKSVQHAETLGSQQQQQLVRTLLTIQDRRDRQREMEGFREDQRVAHEKFIDAQNRVHAAERREDRAGLEAFQRQMRVDQQAFELARDRLRLAEKGEEPAAGDFYDRQQGRVRVITKGEEKADLAAVKAGGQPQFKKLSTVDKNLVERLAVARPIVDRLDQLVDKINVVAPGQNISAGLLQRLKRVAGIGEDITQIENLSVEAGTEITAALSQGQPRVTIFNMVLGKIEPKATQTWSVAKQQVQTMKTTLQNRVQSATGDPDAFNKLSEGFTGYTDAPKPPGTAGWKILP
jgi:hypothetical protein